MKTTDSTLFEAAACWSRPGGHGVGRARLPALAPLVPPPTGRVSPTAPTERRAAERARRLGAGPMARSRGIKWHFAHGDITARNVLCDRDGRSVLIAWEWAGLYPAGYEFALLWSSLVNIPAGRAKEVAAVSAHQEAALLPRWSSCCTSRCGGPARTP